MDTVIEILYKLCTFNMSVYFICSGLLDEIDSGIIYKIFHETFKNFQSP